MSKFKIHKIAVLAFNGAVAGDITTPCEIFSRVELATGELPYQIQVCGSMNSVKTQFFDMHTKWSIEEALTAQTIIVPGVTNPDTELPPSVINLIREAQMRRIRIASICTGAFVLASSGILDGLRVTTHWKAADLLSRLHPKIKVEPNVLFTDNGQVLTSAGASAGIDLCLHMIKNDYGVSTAAYAARLAVAPLERNGGQAQFIVRKISTSNLSLSPVLQWIEARLGTEITLKEISEFAVTSTRTLNRRFQEQLGVSPLQWVIQARVKRAQCMLEETDLPIEHVASDVGFGSSASFREHFVQLVGTNPTSYRDAFRKAPPKLRSTGSVRT